MGQKVNPNGIRLGIVKGITQFGMRVRKTYSENLLTDIKVREF